MQMNEYEINEAAQKFAGHPLLGPATQTLASLVTAVNGCSDGWPYWRAPSRAAAKLQDLVTQGIKAERERYVRPGTAEPDAAQLRAAYVQLRAFRTRRASAGHTIRFRICPAPAVPGDPEPEPAAAPEPRRIRLQITGRQAQVTVAGGPLASGTYTGTVVRLTLAAREAEVQAS